MIARASVALLAYAIATLPACASVPSHFSARSAAAPEAAEPPRAVIGIALREDPPLPGASTEGWSGLASPTGTGMPAGHMHHGGMAMQGMDMQASPDAGQTCMAGMEMGPCNAPVSDADAGVTTHAH